MQKDIGQQRCWAMKMLVKKDVGQQRGWATESCATVAQRPVAQHPVARRLFCTCLFALLPDVLLPDFLLPTITECYNLILCTVVRQALKTFDVVFHQTMAFHRLN